MRFVIRGKAWSKEHHVTPAASGDETWTLHGDGAADVPFVISRVDGNNVFRLIYRGTPHNLIILPGNKIGEPLRFLLDHKYYELDVRNEADLLAELLGEEEGEKGPTQVNCVMPGVVTQLFVETGDTVDADQPLLILEAMKMENEIRSPIAGKVTRLAVGTGTTVAAGALLVVIDDTGS